MTKAFPVELYRLVVAMCDTTGLLSLLRTSRTLGMEAERALYHTVFFSEEYETEEERLFLARVSSCARVAGLVVSLRITHTETSSTEGDFARYLDRLGPALRATVNLQVLHLDMEDESSMFAMLCGCVFQLKEFLHGYISDSAGFMQFLAQQPRLEHLDIRAPPLSIAPRLCPNLSTLSTNYDTVFSILPGRRIRRIKLTSETREDSLEDIQLCAEPLSHVHSLTGQRSFHGRNREILKHTHNLQFLELQGSELESSDIQLLTSLKNLRGLVLVWCTIRGISRDRFIETLFDSTHDLRFVETVEHVDKVYRGRKHTHVEYKRWKRGTQEPRVINKLHDWLTDIP